MNRGTLLLNNDEIGEILKLIYIEKLNIALENKEEEKSVLFNEEELESILDAIGGITNNELLNQVKNKVSNLLRSFRYS